jgi:hypothetical protein
MNQALYAHMNNKRKMKKKWNFSLPNNKRGLDISEMSGLTNSNLHQRKTSLER